MLVHQRVDVPQHRATPEQTPHSPVGTLQPRCWDHIFSSLFWQGPRKISTGSIMGIIMDQMDLSISITYICGHFDISDHMSSPLAMVRIIMCVSGPKSTASLWAFPLLRIPCYPWLKKCQNQIFKKLDDLALIPGLRSLLI
jgi:hypothetical protein